jgi:hypothetical protein
LSEQTVFSHTLQRLRTLRLGAVEGRSRPEGAVVSRIRSFR